MGTDIKHPVPDRDKPSFVIFDIWAIWRSGLSVIRCQKLQNDCLARSGTGCFIAVPIWRQWASKGFKTQKLVWKRWLLTRTWSVEDSSGVSSGKYAAAIQVAADVHVHVRIMYTPLLMNMLQMSRISEWGEILLTAVSRSVCPALCGTAAPVTATHHASFIILSPPT